MKRFHRYLGIAALGAILGAPLSGLAVTPAAQPAVQDTQIRIYDRDYRDYHTWTPQEDTAYRHWLDDHHEKYRKFEKLKAKQQKEYWRWRHDHPDDRH